jgi:hypothetical protein
VTRLANDSSDVGFSGGSPVQALYNGTTQNITSSGVSQQSSAFGVGTTVIRLVTVTNPIWYKIGPNPTAVVAGDSCYLPAGVIEFPQVCRGDKIAVIQVTGASVVNIVESAG